MNRYDIDVQFHAAIPSDVDEAATVQRVREAAAATLDQEEVDPTAGLSVVLTGNDEIQRLNRDFRGVDKPTDVLSFPADSGVPDMEEYLGDVLISLPVAWQQAAAGHHHPLDELSLLAVHGVLHLLGYDHAEPEEKLEMWNRQNGVLVKLGLEVRSPDLDHDEAD